MKLTHILIIVLIVALGMLAVNQTMGLRYKAEFLKSPCDLCEKLNPHLENCFKESSYISYSTEKINLSSFDFNT